MLVESYIALSMVDLIVVMHKCNKCIIHINGYCVCVQGESEQKNNVSQSPAIVLLE